jgi:hypothetical protein
MTPQGRARVTDKDRWQREFTLDKALLYLGSAPGNDIVLPVDRGAGVAARQVQLVALGEDELRFRVVNLGPGEVRIVSQNGQAVPGDVRLVARAVGILGDGDELQLGDFSVRFRFGDGTSVPAQGRAGGRQQGARPRESGDIGLGLTLAQTILDVDESIEGTIAVWNAGDRPGVQFRIELSGYPSDCYEMGPGPILFPGAEKQVPLRLFHPQRPEPAAGECRIMVRASAPDAYPGQRAEAAQTIRVAPFYRHALRFVGEKR